MITLYAFGPRVHPGMKGKGRDLRAQWALEETGLDYQIHEVDFLVGELDSPAYRRLSPFGQVPAIDDEGFVIAESAAVVLYLAEKAGSLIPADFLGRMRVTQWCFAALATVERPVWEIQMIDAFHKGESAGRRTALVKEARHRFDDLERRLEGRAWLADDDFTVADILLATVLRGIRKTDLLSSYPGLKAYHERATMRPAWQRTLASCAERQGVSVADIR